MMQLIYYLVYYLITGILTLNPLGIHLQEQSLKSSISTIAPEGICQSFTTFIDNNLFLG